MEQDNQRQLLDYRSKTFKTFRPMTLDEVKALKYGDHIKVRGTNGVVGVKVNSAVKRWKRDSDRIQVSLKYGLWEYFRIENDVIGNPIFIGCPIVEVS